MQKTQKLEFGCFLRISEGVFVWMILDAGFEMNELIMKCIFNQHVFLNIIT